MDGKGMAGMETKKESFTGDAVPVPLVEDTPTTRIDESRAALVAMIANNPAMAAETILMCRDLVLSFDERLHEAERRMVHAEQLALEAIRLAEKSQ